MEEVGEASVVKEGGVGVSDGSAVLEGERLLQRLREGEEEGRGKAVK